MTDVCQKCGLMLQDGDPGICTRCRYWRGGMKTTKQKAMAAVIDNSTVIHIVAKLEESGLLRDWGQDATPATVCRAYDVIANALKECGHHIQLAESEGGE